MTNVLNWGLLQPEDIECRIATCKDGKTTILLYQETRNCMKHLDAMFGTFGWQIDYHPAGDMIIATMSVWDEEKQHWCTKSDTGSASNIEADKGFCSNCLKRCAVQFGLGRELYTAPRIVIDNSNKYANYYVSSISYTEDRRINNLQIVDGYNNIVFNWSLDSRFSEQQNTQPVEISGFVPRQTKSPEIRKYSNPINENGMLSKNLYLDIIHAENNEKLLAIYNLYPELKQNQYFTGTLNKRKNELSLRS